LCFGEGVREKGSKKMFRLWNKMRWLYKGEKEMEEAEGIGIGDGARNEESPIGGSATGKSRRNFSG
jgi:hypothetical protein